MSERPSSRELNPTVLLSQVDHDVQQDVWFQRAPIVSRDDIRVLLASPPVGVSLGKLMSVVVGHPLVPLDWLDRVISVGFNGYGFNSRERERILSAMARNRHLPVRFFEFAVTYRRECPVLHGLMSNNPAIPAYVLDILAEEMLADGRGFAVDNASVILAHPNLDPDAGRSIIAFLTGALEDGAREDAPVPVVDQVEIMDTLNMAVLDPRSHLWFTDEWRSRLILAAAIR